jgi:hypothetical protein
MPSIEEIRLITIRATADVDKAVADLNKLSAAQDQLGVVSDTTTKATTSVQTALNRQQMQLDTSYRAQTQFNTSQLAITRGYNEGMISLDRYNQLSVLNTKRLEDATGAHSALKGAMSGVQGQLVALAAGAGPVGVFLAGLGPWGLAAAAGIGLASAAFEKMTAMANDLANTARTMERFAETTGLSTDQLQALTHAAAAHGIEAEQTVKSVEKFTASFDELRKGAGAMLTEVSRIDPALANQMMRTKDSATALDLLTKAINNADAAGNIFARNALARAAGGRGGIAALIGISSAVGQAGGLGGLADQAIANGDIVSPAMLTKLKELSVQIEETNRRATQLTATIFSESVLEKELLFAQGLERAARAAKDLADSQSGMSWWQTFFDNLARGEMGTTGADFGASTAMQGARNRLAAGLAAGQRSDLSNVYTPKAPSSEGITLDAAVATSKAQISILGSAATQTELLKNKILELTLAAAKERVGTDYVTRGYNEYGLALWQANEATKQSLGVSTQSEIETAKIIDLQTKERQGLQLTTAQRELATAIIQKEAKAQAEANQVRASALPGLTRMSLDAVDLNKQFDTLAVSGVGHLADSIVSLNSSTMSFGDTFKALGVTVINELEKMIIQMTIFNSLKAMGFGGGGGGGLLGLLGLGGTSADVSPVGATWASGNVGMMGGVPFPIAHTGGVLGSDTLASRYIHPAYFDDAPSFGSGGIVGGEVPVIAHKGEGVFTPGQMAAMGGGSNVVINQGHIYISAAGADPAVVARIDSTLQAFRKSQYSDTVKIVQDASNRGMRLHQ